MTPLQLAQEVFQASTICPKFNIHYNTSRFSPVTIKQLENTDLLTDLIRVFVNNNA